MVVMHFEKCVINSEFFEYFRNTSELVELLLFAVTTVVFLILTPTQIPSNLS